MNKAFQRFDDRVAADVSRCLRQKMMRPHHFLSLLLFEDNAPTPINRKLANVSGYSPRYTHLAVQVSATTTSVSNGSFGLSLFHIQTAMFSLVGFSNPGISFRQK